MSKVLATYPSKSNPSRTYQVLLADAGHLYCTCPKWRFQNIEPVNRTCTHLEAYQAGNKGTKSVTNVLPNWDQQLEDVANQLKHITGGN